MEKTYLVTGVMSGTSMDGLDLACAEFVYDNNRWTFDLKATRDVAYDQAWQHKLNTSQRHNALYITELDREYGRFTGKHVRQFHQDNGIVPDAVASHGHTIFHQPDKGITCQIGNGAVIAAETGVPVVSDFRSLDVGLGGQGAPLVPVGDRFLFGNYDFCLNLGGITNISFEAGNSRMAFDICASNMVLNFLAKEKMVDFDENGGIAAKGKEKKEMLDQLNKLSFYQQPYPKSLGKEWVEDKIFPIVTRFLSRTEDSLATYCRHIAVQTGNAIKDVINDYFPERTNLLLLATGGGVFNDYLIACIREELPENVKLVIPEEKIVKYKEALVFAFMGALRLDNQVNCLASVTGASRDSCSGAVYIGN